MQPAVVEVREDCLRVTAARPHGRRYGWFAVALAVACAVLLVLALTDDSSSSSAAIAVGIQVPMWALQAALALGPADTVVDASGIHRPYRRAVPWSAVERVDAPGRFDEHVTVRLRTGRTARLAVPAQHAALVARIGAVPFGRD